MFHQSTITMLSSGILSHCPRARLRTWKAIKTQSRSRVTRPCDTRSMLTMPFSTVVILLTDTPLNAFCKPMEPLASYILNKQTNKNSLHFAKGFIKLSAWRWYVQHSVGKSSDITHSYIQIPTDPQRRDRAALDATRVSPLPLNMKLASLHQMFIVKME